MPELNVPAVLVATVACFVIGAVYYGVLGDRLAEVRGSAAPEGRPLPMTLAVEVLRCLVLAAVVAGLSGCASPARYVETQGDTGVVAIPSNSDVWPNYNRKAAMALIEKHVGPNYEIVEEAGSESIFGALVQSGASTESLAELASAAPGVCVPAGSILAYWGDPTALCWE